MARRIHLLVVCCILASAATNTALAQSLPPWMLVKAEHVVMASSSALPSAATSEVRESARRQSRSRALLGASAGLLISAALHFAYAAPHRDCEGRRAGFTTSMKAATGLGAVGLAGTVATGTMLGIEAKRYGLHTSWKERLGSAGIGALTAVLSHAALFGAWFGEVGGCD